MANIITIPTPCHEDWNAMTPKDKGRHCGSCCKTVVDFTNWQANEIFLYFKANQNVCGRFTANQLNEPMPTEEDFVKQLSYFNLSTVKKMAAICLFTFLIGTSGCKETDNPLGVPLVSVSKNTIEAMPTIVGDTIYAKPPKAISQPIVDTPKKLMDTPAIIKKTVSAKKIVKGQIRVVESPVTMGVPMMLEYPLPLNDTVKQGIKMTLPVCEPIKTNENNFVMGKMVAPK